MQPLSSCIQILKQKKGISQLSQHIHPLSFSVSFHCLSLSPLGTITRASRLDKSACLETLKTKQPSVYPRQEVTEQTVVGR